MPRPQFAFDGRSLAQSHEACPQQIRDQDSNIAIQAVWRLSAGPEPTADLVDQIPKRAMAVEFGPKIGGYQVEDVDLPGAGIVKRASIVHRLESHRPAALQASAATELHWRSRAFAHGLSRSPYGGGGGEGNWAGTSSMEIAVRTGAT